MCTHVCVGSRVQIHMHAHVHIASGFLNTNSDCPPTPPRLFLLRDSQSNPKAFVLTLCHHQKIKNFQILPVSTDDFSHPRPLRFLVLFRTQLPGCKLARPSAIK